MHTIHKLSALEALRAMPEIRRTESVRLAIATLRHAMTDFQSLHCAYEILANFGEMERTRNGYKSIDPRAVHARCNKLIATLQSL